MVIQCTQLLNRKLPPVLQLHVLLVMGVEGVQARILQAKHIDESEFFYNLIADMLRFFETGSCSFDTAETIEVTKLLVASIKAKANPDQWLEI